MVSVQFSVTQVSDETSPYVMECDGAHPVSYHGGKLYAMMVGNEQPSLWELVRAEAHGDNVYVFVFVSAM